MNTKTFIKLTLIILIFCSNNLFAETLTVPTITAALNYDGNRENIKHLIITDSIAGSDYLSAGSEWIEFRILNLAFPALSEITIYTDQDIPDGGWNLVDDVYWHSSLFSHTTTPTVNGATWIKKFNAPHTKYIGEDAFIGSSLTDIYFPSVEIIKGGAFSWCKSLVTVDFPSATEIGTIIKSEIYLTSYIGSFGGCTALTSISFPLLTTIYGFEFCSSLTTIYAPLVTTILEQSFYACRSLAEVNFPLVATVDVAAFYNCTSLTEINFPLATTVKPAAFGACPGLTDISFGTALEEEAEYDFDIFYTILNYPQDLDNIVPTWNINLTLGKNVLPKPNLTNLTWNYNFSPFGIESDYYWKSITIKYVSVEEEKVAKEEKINIYCIGKNIYYIYDSLEMELYDLMGRLVGSYSNETIIDLNHLSKGVYFLKIFIGGKYTVEKIVVN